MLHTMEQRENFVIQRCFFDCNLYYPRYRVLLKYSQKTVIQACLAVLCRHLPMLQGSVDTTDVEVDSFSESENRSTLECGDVVIDEILATLDACTASSSQSPQDEQNVTGMIKCFNNPAGLLRNTNIFE